MSNQATTARKNYFNPRTFLSTIGKGREMVSFGKKSTIFAQGDATDGLFFIQEGKVQLSVVSEAGKEATLGILSEDDFFGEGGLGGQFIRMSSAIALTDCVLLHVERKALMHAMSMESKLSAMFMRHLVKRNIRYQDDLVDQLFNSSEKRLARVLLLDGPLRQRRRFRNDSSETQSGNSGRDGRDHTLASQFLHEPIQEVGFHQLRHWRQLARPQCTTERRSS